MSDNTTKLTPQEVIAGLAKGLGVQEIPDTYTKQFGGDMLFGLGAEMQRHRGLVPMIVVEGFREKYAQRIFVEDVMKKMGLEDNAQNTQMVTSMISEAEDAVSTLNQSVDAGETISLKITESEPTTLPETRMETVNEPERTVSADDKVDIKLVQTLLSGAIGRTNQLRHDLLVGPSLGLNRPLANIGATSDAWNDTSLGAVNAVIDLLKESNGLSARFSESGYTPEL